MADVDVEERLLRPDEVAAILGIPPGTLANWRYQGRGPIYARVGRHVRYRLDDVNTWIDRHLVRPRR